MFYSCLCLLRFKLRRKLDVFYNQGGGKSGGERRGSGFEEFVCLVIFSSPILTSTPSHLDGDFSVIHSEVMVLDWGQSLGTAVCFEGIQCQYSCSRTRVVCRVNGSLMMSFSVTWREIDPCCVSVSKMPPCAIMVGVSLGCCMYGLFYLRQTRTQRAHT